ncbi:MULTISPECIES: FecR family protein [Sphingomonas]|uniref:FecR family protein n=1 Tax=Sphingomonas TaxID=13687 RepID=UPI00082E1D5E|nr:MULTISPECIES: FecR domain-containing protein [Sphingomonas]MBY0302688.1 FecR domain-containing protein [Sphingomonas ginsenosidimutans]
MTTDDPAARAAAWYARLHADDARSEDTEALDRWMRDDAANALAWRDVHDTDAALDQIRDDPAIAALRADALGDAAPVRHWRRSAIAAALLITVGVGTFAIVERDEATTTAAAPTPRHYAAIDAIRRVTLTDGSVVTLDAGSAIDVAPMGTQRRIVLRSGRAGFAVAKDAAHPFVVTAGAASVTALGTHFTVERRGPDVTVALTEGRVRVDTPAGSRMMIPGQVLSTAGGRPTLDDRGAEGAAEWQSGRLTFAATPLRDVVAQLQRYDRRRIVIADPGLAAHLYSGSLKTQGGTDALVAALEAYRIARVTRRDADRIELAPR